MLKKSSIVLVFTLVLIFALTACGGDTASEPTDSPASGERLMTRLGVLVEATMHGISIKAPDGIMYSFDVDDNTTIEGSEILGNLITVGFRGEYTPGILAVTITTLEEVDLSATENKGSTNDPGAPQPNNPSSTDETIWYMTATVEDATMNELQLSYEDGRIYTFLKDDNTITDPGIVVGCVARVFYKGGIIDGMIATEIHFISEN